MPENESTQHTPKGLVLDVQGEADDLLAMIANDDDDATEDGILAALERLHYLAVAVST